MSDFELLAKLQLPHLPVRDFKNKTDIYIDISDSFKHYSVIPK